MGKLTRTQILTQGITLAGKATSSAAFVSLVATSFNALLRNAYKGWLWPFLVEQATGISLAAAAQSLTIGGGSGGVTNDIDDIFDPIYIYTTDYSTYDKARVRQIRGGPAYREPSIIPPTNNTGLPVEFKARELSGSNEGKWVLTPYPFPDKAYKLSIDYKRMPADIDTSTAGDSTVPDYKNDRTLIQMAKVATLEHMQGNSPDGAYAQELEILASLVAQDFAKDAAKTGTNDNLGLDPNTFRS